MELFQSKQLATDKIKVRGQEVEYSFDLLFARVACVSTPQEMQDNLSFEFAPAMFEKGSMRKNTKSVLGAVVRAGQVIEKFHQALKIGM